MTQDTTPPRHSHLIDAIGQAHAPAQGEVRIVSLVPSITELLCTLGLAGQLVGRTGFCIHPREVLRPVPKVGGTKDVKLDRLRALAPTHVILNIDENPRELLAPLREFVPSVIVTHPCEPEDNRALFRLLGGIFGRMAAADRLVEAFDLALAEARSVAATRPPRKVLYLIWRAPWMTVSRDTYISAMLRTVGWHTLPAEAAQRYPEVRGDEVWLGEVERVLLSSEPYHFRDAHVREAAESFGRPARLVDGEMTSWYGSRAIAGLRYLAQLCAEEEACRS
ncbi:MAG: helical backbone metal receptor [Rhodocyclaceae bacterium]|jgi:ABC-type Fe3+-hydroxamate transport system substrate-binding protein|nr:helical backbone metal receptor [Rhodocyclaceae bacterium]